MGAINGILMGVYAVVLYIQVLFKPVRTLVFYLSVKNLVYSFN